MENPSNDNVVEEHSIEQQNEAAKKPSAPKEAGKEQSEEVNQENEAK